MIVAAVRQVADWLADATNGVNVQLATVPMDDGETAPPAVGIYDATRHAWVARGAIPRGNTGNTPLLLVRGPDIAELPLWPGEETAGWTPVEVLVAYVRRPAVTVASDDELADAYQTLRAAVRALQAQFAAMAASPERMDVALDRPTARFEAEQQKLAGEETILATLVITIPANDPWSMGAIS